MKNLNLLFLALAGVAASAAEKQFIYETAPFPSCHASTIVETAKPGEFLAAWFGGADEGKPDVAIWQSRLTATAGGKWSTPQEIAREEKIATYNPVYFFTPDKLLWMYYRFGPSPMTWTSARKYSKDQGATWSAADYLPAGLLGPIKNKPLVLKNGTILAGSSVESYKSWNCWIERSTDNGKTWTKHGPISVPGELHGIIQPAVVPLGSKKVRLYMRATAKIGKICVSDSTDDGKTWTPARPLADMPNPNSGFDAVGLRDGRIVLVYNHTAKGRSPLNVAVSKDGEKFNKFLDLETEPGEFSYPAIIQASNGDVHITYTWNRKKIRHAVVKLSEVPQQ